VLVNQEDLNLHKHNNGTLYVILLLFMYDMFRLFIRPSSVTAYKCINEKRAVEEALYVLYTS
jgi:hypothetical protein